MPEHKNPRPAIAPQIIDEASEWLIEMREPDVSAAVRESFANWLRASPQHVRAYLEIANLWNDSAHVGPEVLESLHGLDAPNVVPISSVDPPAARQPPRQPRRSRARPVALAASVLLTCIAAGGLAWWYQNRPTQYVADVGEQRTITLEDGSIVHLNSRSSLSVRLSADRREVNLVDGQAHFEVAKDPARPFLVYSGAVTVRAVGTAFDVYRKPNDTIVTVSEGRVLVQTEGAGAATSAPSESAQPNAGSVSAPSAHTVALSAGEQASVNSAGLIEHRPTVNVAAAMSWLQQELVFEGQPLSAVVDEFNRYSRRTVVVTDPQLAAFRINAVFHSTNPDSLLRFLRNFDDVAIEESATRIRISRHPRVEE